MIAAVNNATPGTTIVIAPGVYQSGMTFDNLEGTRDKPIRLVARDPNQPPVISGGVSGIQFRGPQHLELPDLVLRGASGNGLDLDDAGDRGTLYLSTSGEIIQRNDPS